MVVMVAQSCADTKKKPLIAYSKMMTLMLYEI
jgi:hypothetical protein